MRRPGEWRGSRCASVQLDQLEAVPAGPGIRWTLRRGGAVGLRRDAEGAQQGLPVALAVRLRPFREHQHVHPVSELLRERREWPQAGLARVAIREEGEERRLRPQVVRDQLDDGFARLARGEPGHDGQHARSITRSGRVAAGLTRPGRRATLRPSVHVTVLSRGLSIYTTRRLAQAARLRGARVRVLDPLGVEMHLDDRPAAFYRQRKLPPTDVVVPRIAPSI